MKVNQIHNPYHVSWNERHKDIPLWLVEDMRFPSKVDQSYFRDFYYSLNREVYLYTPRYPSGTSWILNHLFAHFWIHHFYSYFDHLNEFNSPTKYKEYEYNYEYIPFYLIPLLQTRSGSLEFHWWIHPSDLEKRKKIKQLVCPNHKRGSIPC